MNHDDVTRAQAARSPAPGTGFPMTFACHRCRMPRPLAGRRKLRRGVSLYVCRVCIAAEEGGTA